MKQQAHILISGRDLDLVSTRGRVLQSAGYRVSTTMNPIEHAPNLNGIQLLILCHTLTAKERQSDLSVLASSAPDAKALCLTPHEDAVDCGTPTLDTFQGTRKMVHVVNQLLSASEN